MLNIANLREIVKISASRAFQPRGVQRTISRSTQNLISLLDMAGPGSCIACIDGVIDGRNVQDLRIDRQQTDDGRIPSTDCRHASAVRETGRRFHNFRRDATLEAIVSVSTAIFHGIRQSTSHRLRYRSAFHDMKYSRSQRMRHKRITLRLIKRK
jgi:hypothetical protein